MFLFLWDLFLCRRNLLNGLLCGNLLTRTLCNLWLLGLDYFRLDSLGLDDLGLNSLWSCFLWGGSLGLCSFLGLLRLDCFLWGCSLGLGGLDLLGLLDNLEGPGGSSAGSALDGPLLEAVFEGDLELREKWKLYKSLRVLKIFCKKETFCNKRSSYWKTCNVLFF